MRFRRRVAGGAAAVLLLLLLSPRSAGAETPGRYTILDLGAPGGDSSEANGINNAGQTVGDITTNAGRTTAVIWGATGIATALGGLPGGATSAANGVNDAGQVTGIADRSDGGYGYPVRWSAAGVIQDLGGSITNQLGWGNAIDPRGVVAGGQRPSNSEGDPVAMLYAVDGTPSQVGTDLGIARGINGHDQVVGGSPAYSWQHGIVTLLPGLFGDDTSGATIADGVNDAGEIVGSAPADQGSASHAVRWYQGSVVDIGTVDGARFSVAKAINASGQVVGTADPGCSPCPPARAWIWTQQGAITPLDTLLSSDSGWSLRTANGINDRGQIVGMGVHHGKFHAFVMSPAYHLNIAFEPTGTPIPVGYVPDIGALWGVRSGGLSYGWNISNTVNTRVRHSSSSPDQRYDRLIHLQKQTPARQWQVSIPNGTYLVHLVAGDPDNFDSVFQIRVNNSQAIFGRPTATTPWLEGTVRVTVCDQKLAVSAGPRANNSKLNYLDIIGL